MAGSNWANAAARARSRSSRLLDHTRKRQFLQQSADQLAVSLADAGYRTELDLYGGRLAGADLVETALSHALSRELDEVLAFCSGEVKQLVQLYIDRFAYQNAKTVLRAVHNGVSVDEVQLTVLPEENDLNAPWLSILRTSSTLGDAIAQMGSLPFGKVLQAADAEADLASLEDLLDQHYHTALAQAVHTPALRGSPLARLFEQEIDQRNVINLLRAHRGGLGNEARQALVLQGGHALRGALLRQAAAAEGRDQLLDVLRRSPRLDAAALDNALQAADESGTLDPVHRWMEEQRSVWLKRMAYLHPVSAVPVVLYLVRKVNEVNDLRLIARGLSAGLTRDDLEPRLSA